MRFFHVAAGLCALTLGACATGNRTASAPSNSDCFRPASIVGYGIVDDHHVSVDAGPSRKYILTTLFNARDLDWTQHIALRSHTDWICTGNGPNFAEIIGGEPRRTYVVTEIVRAPPPPAQGS